ncbi:MAG: NAD(P)-dependent oxidoreductase [Thiotrichales bacterium]
MLKLGYIGLGIMGRPMALNLLNAGYSVTVWARREASTAPLLKAGAKVAQTPKDLAGQCDVIFINVSDTQDVQSLVLGEQGIVAGISAGAVVIDNSTIDPGITRKLAKALQKKDADMLDAPVSGGEAGAIAGTLSIMVGGKQESLARVMSLLEVIGENIVHVGDHGAGQVAKACNQIVVAQTMMAIGEAIVMCEASGVDPAKMREALLGGFAGSKILEVHGQRMLDKNYAPGFKASLHNKDLNIAQTIASDLGIALPGAALASQLINALKNGELADQDSSAIVEIQRRMNQIH